MNQQFRALAAFAGNLGLNTITHMAAHYIL